VIFGYNAYLDDWKTSTRKEEHGKDLTITHNDTTVVVKQKKHPKHQVAVQEYKKSARVLLKLMDEDLGTID
jgi:hypothetical protein